MEDYHGVQKSHSPDCTKILTRRLPGVHGQRTSFRQSSTSRGAGIRQTVWKLSTTLAAVTATFAADLVDFNFVVKRLGDSPPVPPGPLYFDIRH